MSSWKWEVIEINLLIGTVLLLLEDGPYMYTVYMIIYLAIPLSVSTWTCFSSLYFMIILKLIVLPLFFSAVNLTLKKNRRDYSVI